MEAAGETVNQVLRDHQATRDDWGLRALGADLHAWGGRMAVWSKADLGTPALMLDKLRGRPLRHYRVGRNGFGLLDEIAIDGAHVHRVEYWQVLMTLVHECCHAWEEHHGTPPRTASWGYHSKAFGDKAASIGLIVSRYGHTHLAERRQANE